jgi:hypothetical protein
MAYAEKYYHNFTAADDTPYRFSIEERDFTGTAAEIKMGDEPVRIRYKPIGDDRLPFAKLSSLDFSVYAESDFQYRDLLTTDEEKYIVKLINRNTNKVVWHGWLLADSMQESYISPPYTIEFTAVCGLTRLRNIDFLDSSGNFFEGKKTLIELIGICLQKTSVDKFQYIKESVVTKTNQYSYAANGEFSSTFRVIQLKRELFRKIKNDETKPYNCLEVLQEILTPFRCQIFQAFDPQENSLVWRIREITDIATDNPYRIWTMGGVYVSEGTTNEILQMGSTANRSDFHWIEGGQVMNLSLFRRRAEVHLKYKYWEDIANFYNFNSPEWDENVLINYTTFGGFLYEKNNKESVTYKGKECRALNIIPQSYYYYANIEHNGIRITPSFVGEPFSLKVVHGHASHLTFWNPPYVILKFNDGTTDYWLTNNDHPNPYTWDTTFYEPYMLHPLDDTIQWTFPSEGTLYVSFTSPLSPYSSQTGQYEDNEPYWLFAWDINGGSAGENLEEKVYIAEIQGNTAENLTLDIIIGDTSNDGSLSQLETIDGVNTSTWNSTGGSMLELGQLLANDLLRLNYGLKKQMDGVLWRGSNLLPHNIITFIDNGNTLYWDIYQSEWLVKTNYIEVSIRDFKRPAVVILTADEQINSNKIGGTQISNGIPPSTIATKTAGLWKKVSSSKEMSGVEFKEIDPNQELKVSLTSAINGYIYIKDDPSTLKEGQQLMVDVTGGSTLHLGGGFRQDTSVGTQITVASNSLLVFEYASGGFVLVKQIDHADAFDSDALAFFSGSNLTWNEKIAVDYLVKRLKQEGYWNDLSYIYPLVGQDQTSVEKELKAGTNNITFTNYNQSTHYSEVGLFADGSLYGTIPNPINSQSHNVFFYVTKGDFVGNFRDCGSFSSLKEFSVNVRDNVIATPDQTLYYYDSPSQLLMVNSPFPSIGFWNFRTHEPSPGSFAKEIRQDNNLLTSQSGLSVGVFDLPTFGLLNNWDNDLSTANKIVNGRYYGIFLFSENGTLYSNLYNIVKNYLQILARI